MIGDPSNPVLPQHDYCRVMSKLSNQYDMLKESNCLGTNYAQGLMSNLNPIVNPGGSQGLLGGLERIINERGY
jgi:hypothetical protein